MKKYLIQLTEAIGGLIGWLIFGLMILFFLGIMFFDKFYPTGL